MIAIRSKKCLVMVLVAITVGILPGFVVAEETFQLQSDFELLLNLQKQAEEQAKEAREAGNNGNVPAMIEELESLKRVSRSPRNPVAPVTAKEAMVRLDAIGGEIEELAMVVKRFDRSRNGLLAAIARLSRSERRNQVFVSGWAPVLVGDLRLLRAREQHMKDEFWVVVALVILEKQVAWLDQRLQQSTNQRQMMKILSTRKRKIDQHRHGLHETLVEIRADLQVIRHKAVAESRTRS